MDVAGSTSKTNEELQKEWYQMGTDFRFGAGGNSSAISISGLDEQFEASLALAMDLIKNPSTDEQTLERMKGILLKSREDQKSSPPAISRALTLYNRYGEESPMLEALTREEIMGSTVDELFALPAELLNFKHTLSYTGSMPLEDLVEVLRRQHPLSGELADTPDYRFRTARELDETEIYVVDQQTAQAQVRIEFPDGVYDRDDSLISSIYTNYFGSGMSSSLSRTARGTSSCLYGWRALCTGWPIK